LLGANNFIKPQKKTDGSHREVRIPQPVVDALSEQKKRTYKANPENFVFLNKLGQNIHRHTLNKNVIKPTLKKAGLAQNRSIKDTRASYITNCVDNGERMSFIIRQVGHTNTNMLVKHYYRWMEAPNDGDKLVEAWNSTRKVPGSAGS
jgi:integrase